MSTMTNERYDLCINGAGPVGATLACRLAAEGMRVLVLDRAALPGMEDPSLDGRAYAIAEGSRVMLQAAGIWDNLPDVAQPIHEIRVADGRPHEAPSPLFLHFGRDDAPDGQSFGWMVEARDLRLAINRTLAQYPTLDVRAPDTGTFTFHDDHVSIRLASGPTVTAKLAIAAEGRRSPLREQARIGLTKIPYHQYGIVATIAHEKPHDGVALEQFLPEGPFARLPMPPSAEHPHRSAIVWAEGAEATIRCPEFHSRNVVKTASERSLSGLARTDTDELFHLGHHNFAVADFACTGCGHHSLHDIFHNRIRHNDLDLELGQEAHVILGTPVNFGLAFLAAETFNFGNREPLNPEWRQCFTDVIEFEGFDDGGNKLHSGDVLIRSGRRPGNIAEIVPVSQ